MEINGYQLSRAWFDFCFENPELITPTHTAIYCFAIEHCNRLGWKEKFGFPSQMTMDALGIKKHQTYIKHFNDLVEWGFFKLIQKSTNQYSANIICLQTGLLKNGKALDKAFKKHWAKQDEPTGQSTGQSKVHIDKPLEPITKEPLEQGNRNLTWYKEQIDPIFMEQMKMNHKGKDIEQAIKDSYAHMAADSNRLALAESGDCKRLLNTWLTNIKNNGTRSGFKGGVTETVPSFSGNYDSKL